MNEGSINLSSEAIVRCRRLLRRLVLIEIVLTFIVIAVSVFQTFLLPPALQEFERQAAERFGLREIALLCLAVPSVHPNDRYMDRFVPRLAERAFALHGPLACRSSTFVARRSICPLSSVLGCRDRVICSRRHHSWISLFL
jgi:hypothetical protein